MRIWEKKKINKRLDFMISQEFLSRLHINLEAQIVECISRLMSPMKKQIALENFILITGRILCEFVVNSKKWFNSSYRPRGIILTLMRRAIRFLS